MLKEEADPDECDFYMGALYYTKNGVLKGYESNEVEWTGEYEKYDVRRFEEAFVDLLYPFRTGDLVHAVGSDEVGIAITEKDDEGYEASHKRRADLRKEGFFNNYANTSIVVEYADDNGDFDHRHVPVAELESANLDEKNPLKDVLQYASRMLKGECGIQMFQMMCEELASKG